MLKTSIVRDEMNTDQALLPLSLEVFPLIKPGDSVVRQTARLIIRNKLPWTMKNQETGVPELKKAVELSPDDFPCTRAKLAFACDSMGKLDGEEAAYRDAYRIMPESIVLNNRFELMLIKQHNFKEADKMMSRDLELAVICRWR